MSQLGHSFYCVCLCYAKYFSPFLILADLNGTLDKLKTELTDARKHTKELELSSKQRNDSSATASRRFDDGAKQV
jgi:hypothetical protein